MFFIFGPVNILIEKQKDVLLRNYLEIYSTNNINNYNVYFDMKTRAKIIMGRIFF